MHILSGPLLFAGLLASQPALFVEPFPSPSQDQGRDALPRFVDRSEAAGLSIVTYSGGAEKNHILESNGNGILALDYDSDGYPDLYFVAAYRLGSLPDAQREERSALYRNNGDGTFADVTQAAGVAAAGVYGHGGCVGDVDADGLPDLYLTAVGPNILYRNNGDATFTDITQRAQVGDNGASIGATFFDADAIPEE